MFAIEAPEHELSRGGLLQVVTALESEETQLFYQGVTFQGALCGHARPVPAPGDDKTFDVLPIITGEAFSIYRGVDFSLFQADLAEEEARVAFGAGESWAVERAVHGLWLGAEAIDLTPTPGTPVTKPKQALGILQQYAADNYSGLPMLHANKYGAELMIEDLSNDENYLLHTKQGVPFVNGGGYPTGSGPAATPAGATWVYATGQLTLWRGVPIVVPNAYHLKDNRNYSLMEVTWVATVECFQAAVLVGA